MLALLQKYSTPGLALLAILVVSLWVHDHTQQAVKVAMLRHDIDSVSVQMRKDSIDAAARDSVSRALLDEKAASEAAARASAQAAAKAKDAALTALATAVTAHDSVVVLQVALAQADTQITALSNAVTAADAQIAQLHKDVLDRDGQIAGLRRANTDLVAKLKTATKSSMFSGTTATLLKTALAAKGLYDVARGR